MAREKVYIPEVIEADSKLPPDLIALRNLAMLMDEAVPIPGTRRRIGLDAGLGLIPGVGDVVGALLSAWIIFGAIRHRVPLRKIVRMIVNVLIDLTVGAVPLIGDVFDVLFEENMMNLRILMQYRDRRNPPRGAREIAGAALVVTAVLGLAALALLAAMVATILWITGKR